MATNEVKLKLSVDGAKAVLSDFDRVRSGMSGVSDAATTAAGAMRALGAAFSVGAVVAWGKAMIDAADAMNDMSQRVGIAVKDLAKYELAASQSGTTMETLARGIKGLAGNLVEHGAALKKAGIDTSNADKAMQQLANVFASMPDGVEKTNLAVKLFGKAGMDMIPMLNLGAEGLQTAAEKTAAYATQMAAMAPLADAFNDNLSVMSLNSKTLSMTMFNEVLPSLVKVTDAMTQADDQGNSLASVFGKGLRTAFETVALIASDVIFVFQGVGREIGGIAAQVVAAATGNWSGFSAISDAMKEDAKKARIELDRFQENLVSRAEKVQTAYNKRQGFGEQVKSGTSGSTLLAALGADKAGTEAAKAANALLKERIELAKWNTKAVDELFDAQEKVRLQTEDQIKTARTTLEQIEFETRLLEMNTEQRAQATLERDLEREGIVKGTLAYDAYIVKLREAMAIKTGKEAGIKAADDMREAQQKAAEESSKYWEDALMRAFESGKGFFQSLWDTIKNTLKTQVLRVMVSATGLTGMSAAGASVAGGGGADMFGLANTASSLSNLYSAGSSIVTIGSQVAAGTMGIANALGTMAANATGTGISGLLAANGAYGTAAAGSASAAAGGAMGGLAAIPGWGWAALGVAALVGSGMFDGGGGPKTESSYGNMAGLGDTSAIGVAGTYAKGVEDAWTTLAKQLDLSTQLKVGAFTSIDSAGDAMTQFGASATVNGVGVYDRGARLGGIENVGRSEEALQAAMQEEATRLLFAALKASDLPAQYKTYLNSVADNVAAMNAAIGDVTLVSNFTTALQALPFANLKNLGFDAAKGLIEVAGGLEALGANLNTYYTLYYSEAERLAVTSDRVATALAEVNVAMPVTKDAYRALVDSLDLTTAAGRSAYAVMMTLAPEFAQVADAAAAAATESVKLMNDVFDTLQNRLTSLVDSIASERAAVAGASAGMLGLQPKTAAQLAAEIAGAKVALPSDAGVLSANAAMATAAANVAAKNTAVEQARALSPSTALLDAAKSSLDSAVATIAQRQTTADWYRQDQGGRFAGYVDAGLAGFDARGIYGESEELYSVTAGFMLRAANLALPPVQASYNAALADYSAAMTVYANNVAAAQATLSTATTAQSTAQAAAKQALLNYAAAMTQYSGDAEKAVKVLSQLREETVAYYEAQKELAGLMTTSAANLRGAVQTSQFGQLATGAALAQQQADFARNYSLALATSGAAKAGYADNLTAALPALTSALMDTSSTRSAWALATAKLYSQSETIATQLDSAAAGMNYEAESLSLLGSIDVALGELDTNTAILKNAIDGGTATSAAGLRAIVTQLGGVPTFASGGLHAGGLRVVGENGPELEVTGPSRIFNASQTRSLMQGGGTSNQDLVNELRALRQSNENMRAELRAIASATVKTAKILGRVTQDGESITTTVLAA